MLEMTDGPRARRGTVRTVAAVLAGASLLAGCGSAGADAADDIPVTAMTANPVVASAHVEARVSPTKYRQQFCLAWHEFHEGMQFVAGKYGWKFQGEKDRARIQKIAGDQYQDMILLTRRSIETMKKAGIPDVAGGAEGVAAVSSYMSSLLGSISDVRTGLTKLDPANAATFDQGLKDLGGRFAQAVTDTTAALPTDKLDPTFSKILHC